MDVGKQVKELVESPAERITAPRAPFIEYCLAGDDTPSRCPIFTRPKVLYLLGGAHGR